MSLYPATKSAPVRRERYPEDDRPAWVKVRQYRRHIKDEKRMVPCVSKCFAVTCLIFNIFMPGFGTFLAACAVCCCADNRGLTGTDKFFLCCMNLMIAPAQLLLTPLLFLGWMWGIMWGASMIECSNKYYGIDLDEGEQEYVEEDEYDRAAKY